MLVSMPVRCEHCGYESDVRYRFCGMCGAKLPEPPPPPEPIAPEPAREKPVGKVSGPSFLGLADEPDSTGAYLLEDEVSKSHWGRYLVLLIMVGALGAAGWHWRGEVRAYVVAHLAQRPSSNQSEQASSPAASISTSASEAAPGVPSASDTSSEKPKTGVGDMPTTPPAAQTAAPPVSSAANSEQPSAAPAPAEPNPKQDQIAGGTAPAAEEAPRTESAADKPSKSKVTETSAPSSSADQLEAEGERYLYGTGVSSNCGRAETDLQAAAEQGSSKADSVLGTMYATGHCVNRDLPLAYRWFAMALKRDPGNARLQDDLRVLWNQMTPEERQVAMRRQ